MFFLLHANLNEVFSFILDIPNNTDCESGHFEVMLSRVCRQIAVVFHLCCGTVHGYPDAERDV